MISVDTKAQEGNRNRNVKLKPRLVNGCFYQKTVNKRERINIGYISLTVIYVVSWL